MRYGISLPNFGPFADARRVGDLARAAEEAGWDGFFLWDHVLFGPLPAGDPWVLLTAAALSTSRIRLGALVTPLPRRRPIKYARETVTLDHLSGGRLIAGVGLGAGPWEWEYLGEEPDLHVRAEMLEEALEVVTRAWSAQPFRFDGKHYQVRGDTPTGDDDRACFFPPSRQQPRIPVWVAGGWPVKAPFERAARWDGVVPMRAGLDFRPLEPEDVRAIVSFIAGRRRGSDPFDVTVSGDTEPADAAAGERRLQDYAAAGTTWWIENISPVRWGWDFDFGKPWPVQQMEERVRLGPVRAGSG